MFMNILNLRKTNATITWPNCDVFVEKDKIYIFYDTTAFRWLRLTLSIYPISQNPCIPWPLFRVPCAMCITKLFANSCSCSVQMVLLSGRIVKANTWWMVYPKSSFIRGHYGNFIIIVVIYVLNIKHWTRNRNEYEPIYSHQHCRSISFTICIHYLWMQRNDWRSVDRKSFMHFIHVHFMHIQIYYGLWSLVGFIFLCVFSFALNIIFIFIHSMGIGLW